jgi:hypothetical protein
LPHVIPAEVLRIVTDSPSIAMARLLALAEEVTEVKDPQTKTVLPDRQHCLFDRP